MSDDEKPKGAPGAPVEGRTQAFRLKIDGWMSELITQDFDLEAPPPAAAAIELGPQAAPNPGPAEPAQVDPAAARLPKNPHEGTPPRSG